MAQLRSILRLLLVAPGLVACGDGESASSSCTARQRIDGSVVVRCSDGSEVVIEAGTDGTNGTDGTDGTNGTNGADGTNGTDGADGAQCTIETDGDLRLLVCDNGTVATLADPRTLRRHVILLIGDGMGAAHQIATSRYLYGSDNGLTFQTFPTQAFVTTYDVTAYNQYASSLDQPEYSRSSWDPTVGYDPTLGGRAPYPILDDLSTSQDYFLPGGVSGPCTDSAAAATAMATGYKTSDGVMSQLPDGTNVETIAEELKRVYGMAIGVLSTQPISHATPGAFLAHNESRNAYTALAKQILTVTQPEVALSAGYGAIASFIGTDNLAALEADTDYLYVHPEDGTASATLLAEAATQAVTNRKKLFGLFGAAYLEWPAPADAPGAPAMTRSDADPTLSEMTQAALEVLSQDPQGFFLMVEQGDIDKAAHSNDFAHTIGNLWDLEQAVKTVIDYVDLEGDDVDWSNTTVFVVADHETGYLRLGDTPLGQGELPDTSDSSSPITWGSTWHTNQLVTLSATGAYAQRVSTYATHYSGTNILDNTDIHSLLLDAAMR